MKRTQTVAEQLGRLDAMIARARLARRPGVFLARLEGRRERLIAGERERAEREASALLADEQREVARAKSAAAVEGFLEASLALLEHAPAVGPGDAADLQEIMTSLASWWPPKSEDGDDGATM